MQWLHRGAFLCKLWKKFAQVCSVCSGHIFFKVCTVLAPLPGRCANFFSDRKKFAHLPGCLLRMMSKLLIKFGCHLRCLPRKVCKLLIKFGCRLRCLFILMCKLFPHCVQTLNGINVFFIDFQRQRAAGLRLARDGAPPPPPACAWSWRPPTRQPAARHREKRSHRICPQHNSSESSDG